ncbi:lysylphosphatidylglycerol synthase transmembrane domain-containing protein [Micromonospora sp. NPDC048999]|uniref:lysylphosphatidylglycerol synthase transmembrane domain-containing protein n=1 Tax=Micromonospora sp. NPDC048999 TaxID=3155391 RepID=UPI00340EB55C
MARLLAVAVVVGLTAIGLRGRLPAPEDVLNALASADYSLILLAALLQIASIGAFALQQRRLLSNMNVQLRRGSAFAIILASTALSITVPAGPVVATAFTIRKYQHAGATREVAAATVVVSGLASIGGLALLYAGGGGVIVARNPAAFLNWQPLVVVIGLAVLTTAAVLIGRRHSRWSSPGGSGERGVSGIGATRYLRTVLNSARDAWRAGAGLNGRDWAVALAYATVKWLADLMCLTAAARSLDLPSDLMTLAGIYLSVQIVRQVPLTPGGVGVVETALAAGLTAAGASGISAAAAVLIYRLLSCWLIIPVGGIAALMLRRGHDTSA